MTHPDPSTALADFASLAAEYCRLIDEREQYTGDQLLNRVHRLLPRLYSAALTLPCVGFEALDAGEDEEGIDDEADEGYGPADIEAVLAEERKDRIDRERWREIFRSLSSIFGEKDAYAEVFDPYADPPDEPVTGSLSDDLTDIYGDLADGLAKWRRAEHGSAANEWRMMFIIHWGEHTTGALRAIHALAADGKLHYPRLEA